MVLREELLTRARNDRAARHGHALGAAPRSAVEQVEAENMAFLTRQLSVHGWLDADLVGEHGADACWRLVHHAPIERQLAWLPLIQAALFQGWAEEPEVTRACVGAEGPRTGEGPPAEGTPRCGDPARLSRLADPARLAEMRAVADALSTGPEERARAQGFQVIAHVRRDNGGGGGARLAVSWPEPSSVRLFVTALLRDLAKNRSDVRRRCWCEVWTPDETGTFLETAALNPDTGAVEWDGDTIDTIGQTPPS
jgi:hypothetical protein